MNLFEPTYKPMGASAILIEWPSEINEEILRDIKIFVSKIENKLIKQILDVNYIYHSILVLYDENEASFDYLKKILKEIYIEETIEYLNEVLFWEIPVCYNEEFGIDLSHLSTKLNLSIEEIITLHCEATYKVFGIGFLPGFLYLGGLSKQLHFPRKMNPRFSVPEGAVGIGKNQTGIYPQESPGGWQIIGRTPISIFNVKNDEPCLIAPGDEIKFVSISKDEYYKLKEADEKGKFKLKPITR